MEGRRRQVDFGVVRIIAAWPTRLADVRAGIPSLVDGDGLWANRLGAQLSPNRESPAR
jgi:hypothetical protein